MKTTHCDRCKKDISNEPKFRCFIVKDSAGLIPSMKEGWDVCGPCKHWIETTIFGKKNDDSCPV